MVILCLISIMNINGIYSAEVNDDIITIEEETDDLITRGNIENTKEEPESYANKQLQTNNPILSPTSNSYSVAHVQDASVRVRNFIENRGRLPNFVTINNRQVEMADFLYMLSTTTLNLHESQFGPIVQYSVMGPISSFDQVDRGNIQRVEYLQLAQGINDRIAGSGQAPSYFSSSRGVLGYESLIHLYSRINAFYFTHHRLPNFANVSPWTGEKLPDIPPVPIVSDYKIELLILGTGGDVTKNPEINEYIPLTSLSEVIFEYAMIGTPILEFGDGDGEKLLILAGIHGNEAESNISLMKYLEYIKDLNFQGTIYAIPFAIPYSTSINSRNWKGQDPNRNANIPGTPGWLILQYAQDNGVSYILDVHSGGDLTDYSHGLIYTSTSKEDLQWANYINSQVGSAVEQGSPHLGMISFGARELGINTLTLEVERDLGCTLEWANVQFEMIKVACNYLFAELI